MTKTLFTLSLVAFSLMAYATETPFRKSPNHPAREQVKKAFAHPAAALRTSSTVETMPDSMHFSTWENNAWQLEEVAGLRYDSRGRMQHMLMYDRPGAGSRQFAAVDYHYTPAGELGSYVFSTVFAGLRREEFRLQFAYDAQGNKTSGSIHMPDSTGTMVTVFGDSLAYTYDQRNRISSATLFVFDFMNFTGWIPLQQISNISWDGNNRPEAFESAYWDDDLQQWDNHRLFTHVKWGFGWNGFSRLFNTMHFELDFSVYEPVDFRFDEPSAYLSQYFDGSRWQDEELRDDELDGQGRVITIRSFYHTGSQWASSNLLHFDYQPLGIGSITTYLYDENSAQHVPFDRTTYRYHTNGSMATKDGELHDGIRWQPLHAKTYSYSRNAGGQVSNQLVRELDMNTQLFNNYSLAEFFYRQPVAASTRDQARSIPMEVYPNPTSGPINIGIGEEHASAELRVRNLQGQLLLSQKHQPGNGPAQLSLENLPAGIYLVEAIAGSEHGVMRVVKQ